MNANQHVLCVWDLLGKRQANVITESSSKWFTKNWASKWNIELCDGKICWTSCFMSVYPFVMGQKRVSMKKNWILWSILIWFNKFIRSEMEEKQLYVIFNCHIEAIKFHSFNWLCADWLFSMTDFRFRAHRINGILLTPISPQSAYQHQ